MDVLSDDEVRDLEAALDDEYRARAGYRQVIADFGAVRPFVNIVDAEERHVEALLGLFDRYGLPVPADRWRDRAPRFASLEEACAAGVAAEIENAGLYEGLLRRCRHPDVRAVYERLREASAAHHLPAFERCVERGRGRGRGPAPRGGGPSAGGPPPGRPAGG